MITAVDPRTGVELTRLADDMAVVTGPPAHVTHLVAAAVRLGRVAHVSRAVPATRPGEVSVTFRVHPPRPLSRRKRRPRWVLVTAGAAAAVVLAGTAWLAMRLVQVVIANAALVLAAVLVAAALVVPWRRPRRKHCPGC
jgi:hypothetical protein